MSLPFHVVPLCPGEIGLFSSRCWRSSSEVARAMHEPKIEPLPPLPPFEQGEMPAWKKRKWGKLQIKYDRRQ